MAAAVEMLESEAKQRLLEELLQSSAFGRSDQLRQMLRYLVQEELAGRGDQLSEYAIGVNALGRPENYSPEVDSTVRTRAHELRKRMEEYFREEPARGWRIELPKGTYRPRFVRPVEAVPEPPVPLAAVQKRTFFWPGFAAGVLSLLVLGVAAKALWPLSEGERAARDIWGPLVTPDTTVSVMLATPPQLWVREFGDDPLPAKDPSFILPVPDDPRFREWYKVTTAREPRQLILHRNGDSPLGGEAEAAIRLAAFLAAHGVHAEILHGDRASEIKDRNAVVLGRAEYSRAAAALQPAGGFAVKYLADRRELGVVSADGRQAFFRDLAGRVNYGLITVLTKQTDSGPHRTLLFAGINSDGSDAAMDYLTSLRNLADLSRALRQGRDALPDNYQLVVRSHSTDRRTMQSERVAIQVLGK